MRNGTRRTVGSQALKALQQSLAKLDVVPPEWKTREQYQNEWDCSMATATHTLQDLIAAGKAEMKKFRVQRGQFKSWPVPHYRIK